MNRRTRLVLVLVVLGVVVAAVLSLVLALSSLLYEAVPFSGLDHALPNDTDLTFEDDDLWWTLPPRTERVTRLRNRLTGTIKYDAFDSLGNRVRVEPYPAGTVRVRRYEGSQ